MFSLLHIFMVQKTPYNRFKVFGYLTFASSLSPMGNKFTPRSHPCINIGFSSTSKGHILLNIHTKQIFTSRDCVFHENIFPYHHQSSQLPLVWEPSSLHTCIQMFMKMTLHQHQHILSTSPIHSTQHYVDQIPSHSSHSFLIANPIPNVRGSSRQRNIPKHLYDYLCPTINQIQ